ncbi:TRAP transporter small permease [Photobacterium sp. BZF1]|uniref:TRAP transporter small permease n=1 Tax=Photobacterium TaxID=657 RepID=UPI001653589B|nr:MULTISPECIES: TRAP transporter small permease [Photobacterium]MBC7003095.1 TRAP transporter small permease [Photobacterium sp. BZF1]MBY5945683.1 TRAP transporter small permease [Photobacterium rosenbergii]
MMVFYKKLLSVLAALSLFILFSVMLAASISRYFLDSPILWSEEVAKYSMIYGVMFGMILCYLEGLHIKFSVLDSFLSKKSLDRLNILTDIAVLASGVLITWSGYLFVIRRGSITSPGTGLSMYFFQSAIVIGGAGLTIAAIMKLASYIQLRRYELSTLTSK